VPSVYIEEQKPPKNRVRFSDEVDMKEMEEEHLSAFIEETN